MNYEILSNKCKIKWKPNFKLTSEKYTQVSAFIYNKNKLLIVKTNNNWTIPGGHLEIYEYTLGVLIREVMEEAKASIKDIKYLGAVEVIENEEKYYQLRYFARIKKIYKFKKEWETTERKFVNLKDLDKYIPWSNGITLKK